MIRPAIAAVALAACTSTSPPPAERPDATPLACASPTTTTRYRIDSAQVPLDSNDSVADAFVLDAGSAALANAYGAVLAAFDSNFAHDPDAAIAAQLAAAVDWEIAIETCPATGESRVRVGSAGGTTTRAGGVLTDGTLTASHGCGEAPIATLSGSDGPGFVTADQLIVDLAIGSDELSGRIGFALDATTTTAVATYAFTGVIDASARGSDAPAGLIEAFGGSVPGGVTSSALASSPLFTSLMAPDIDAANRIDDTPTCPADAVAWLSFGLAIHAIAE